MYIGIILKIPIKILIICVKIAKKTIFMTSAYKLTGNYSQANQIQKIISTPPPSPKQNPDYTPL